MTLGKKLLNKVWGTFINSIGIRCQHGRLSHHHKHALPYYGGIAAIGFGIIQRVGNWSFLSFNNHASTVILEKSKMEKGIHHPIKLPLAVTMKHTFFNLRSPKAENKILYPKYTKSNQADVKRKAKEPAFGEKLKR